METITFSGITAFTDAVSYLIRVTASTAMEGSLLDSAAGQDNL